ncbi:MAG: hypothetical protein C4305_02605 [Thermoleophilia bacterium]
MFERQHTHEPIAAYALDALSNGEKRAVEEHLKKCPSCGRELEQLQAAASALAFAVEQVTPPSDLRGRVLDRARAERRRVLAQRSRPARVAWGVAAAALAAAIGLGVWGAVLSRSLDSERAARRDDARAAAILASAHARVRRLGRVGQVAVLPDGRAALVVALPPAPAGRTYEAWVIQDDRPLAAGLFRGGRDTLVVLDRPVPRGARIALTVEPEGGSSSPTGPALARTGAI